MHMRTLDGVTVSVNVEFPTGNALADTSRKMKMDGFRQAERNERALENAFLDSKVSEGCYRHVSADAGKAVQVEGAHEFWTFAARDDVGS